MDTTANEKKIVNFISGFINEQGYAPSVRDICKGVGLRSTSTIQSYITKLIGKGILRRSGSISRTLEIVGNNSTSQSSTAYVPIVGKVAAGLPILAQENIEDTFPISTNLLNRFNDQLFMLRVQGNSMVDIGILNEDLVLINQQETCNNGEIVVALVDDGATVKRFYKENGHIRLQPENKTMAPIIVSDAKVLGKVVGVFRDRMPQ